MSRFGCRWRSDHTTGRIRVDVIFLYGITLNSRDTLLKTLRNIMLATGINLFNQG